MENGTTWAARAGALALLQITATCLSDEESYAVTAVRAQAMIWSPEMLVASTSRPGVLSVCSVPLSTVRSDFDSTLCPGLNTKIYLSM